MIDAGCNAKVLSIYLGHASISITIDRYGHLIEGHAKTNADLLDAYLERADSAKRIAQLEAARCRWPWP